MITKRTLLLVISGIFFIYSTGGSVTAQQMQTDDNQASGAESVAAVVGSRIFYQGMLKQNDQPVNGVKNLTFKMFTDEACTTQIGDDMVINDVSVENGLFQVYLDPSPNPFNGQALWLNVIVGTSDLGGCQEILPVPYALSLRPGAYITSSSTGAIFRADNKGSGSGVFGSSPDGSAGVWGHSDNHNGVLGSGQIGVYGYTFEETGKGVMGWNKSETGDAIGVLGLTDSTHGYAGYFVNRANEGYTTGIYAKTNSTSASAIYGWAYTTDPASSDATGVRGLTNAASGKGVYGYAQSTSGGYGVFAQSKGPGAAGCALRAEADNSNGIAIWGKNTSSDSTLVLENYGSGDLIKAFAGSLQFRVANDGKVYGEGFYSMSADMAEMLPAVGNLQPGDVLVIGMDGNLARSTQAYQANVVGVYSTQPGIIGGYSEQSVSEGKVPLAVTGIVPVKVSAENGSIQAGDLLVSASIPGYAMRSGDNPAVGTVIGKALSSLVEGQGLIQMLVMLR
jgi:hypothetical protein